MNCSFAVTICCQVFLFGFSSYKGAVSEYEVIPVELPETHMNLNLKVVLSLKLKCVVILLTFDTVELIQSWLFLRQNNPFCLYPKLGVICYDDACHLKRFAQNPIRCSKTDIASRICEMEILCDRFHFKNHVDGWCRTYCNPLKSETLKVQRMSFSKLWLKKQCLTTYIHT